MITLKSTQALFAVAAILISSCAVSFAAEKTLAIAYSGPSAEFPWLALVARTAREDAKKLNVDSDCRCSKALDRISEVELGFPYDFLVSRKRFLRKVVGGYPLRQTSHNTVTNLPGASLPVAPTF
jgi:hypothetical protein